MPVCHAFGVGGAAFGSFVKQAGIIRLAPFENRPAEGGSERGRSVRYNALGANRIKERGKNIWIFSMS